MNGRLIRMAWLNGVAGSSIWPTRVRRALLRFGGLRIGFAGVVAGQRFSSGHDVTIGDGSFVNAGCLFDSAAPIRIGRNVAVGPQVAFVTSTHVMGSSTNRAGSNRAEPIIVEDGAWIGARATLLPGAIVRRGCVIAAGSVLRGDTEPDTMYGGVPAHVLRSIPDKP